MEIGTAVKDNCTDKMEDAERLVHESENADGSEEPADRTTAAGLLEVAGSGQAA